MTNDYFRPLPVEYFPTPIYGQVLKPIRGDRPGRLLYNGAVWWAKPANAGQNQMIPQQQTVAIIGRQGLTLLIQLPSD